MDNQKNYLYQCFLKLIKLNTFIQMHFPLIMFRNEKGQWTTYDTFL